MGEKSKSCMHVILKHTVNANNTEISFCRTDLAYFTAVLLEKVFI